MLKERTDPVRDGEMWLLSGLWDEKDHEAGKGGNERNSKKILQTLR